MDCLSVEEGLQKLLSEATMELKKINPEILIEFRQSYIGPIVSQYGNLFRVTDCPNDAIFNRIGSLDLRITSDKIPVHSDMLMWNKDDTNESVMYQLLATMFCVPQISVRFDNIAEDHRKLLKAYLDFWRTHRMTILEGELDVWGVDANYTMAKAKLDGESVAVLYESTVFPFENEKVSYVFNSTGKDGIYIESQCDLTYCTFNMFGEKLENGVLSKGVNRLNLENCGMVKMWRDK